MLYQHKITYKILRNIVYVNTITSKYFKMNLSFLCKFIMLCHAYKNQNKLVLFTCEVRDYIPAFLLYTIHTCFNVVYAINNIIRNVYT